MILDFIDVQSLPNGEHTQKGSTEIITIQNGQVLHFFSGAVFGDDHKVPRGSEASEAD